MAIEAGRQVVASLPLTAPMFDSLRRTARLLSTHFSTQIEGNRLTLAQVQAVLEGWGTAVCPTPPPVPALHVEMTESISARPSGPTQWTNDPLVQWVVSASSTASMSSVCTMTQWTKSPHGPLG